MTKLFVVSYLLCSVYLVSGSSTPLGLWHIMNHPYCNSGKWSIDPYCVFEDQSYLSGWKLGSFSFLLLCLMFIGTRNLSVKRGVTTLLFSPFSVSFSRHIRLPQSILERTSEVSCGGLCLDWYYLNASRIQFYILQRNFLQFKGLHLFVSEESYMLYRGV
ncbi:hypothetical protein WN944_004927 [Citrus x changshan-huyou]|uniref:Uncharacterized protein n=1 Tax=Citrus x changshan-huyou TaxID=2935761 RepID=A0AAP0M5W8_9ROSI